MADFFKKAPVAFSFYLISAFMASKAAAADLAVEDFMGVYQVKSEDGTCSTEAATERRHAFPRGQEAVAIVIPNIDSSELILGSFEDDEIFPTTTTSTTSNRVRKTPSRNTNWKFNAIVTSNGITDTRVGTPKDPVTAASKIRDAQISKRRLLIDKDKRLLTLSTQDDVHEGQSPQGEWDLVCTLEKVKESSGLKGIAEAIKQNRWRLGRYEFAAYLKAQVEKDPGQLEAVQEAQSILNSMQDEDGTDEDGD